jgi:phosphoenolpyruvate-protein kinase (PTS system EI component)
MAAMQIPQVKEVIRSVSKKDCDALTRRLLKQQDAAAAEEMLKKFVSSVVS